MAVEKIDDPAKIEQFLSDRYISNLMFLIWHSRKDLQQAFDLKTKTGQESYVAWYDVSVEREYGINPSVVTESPQDGTHVLSNKPSLYFRLRGFEHRLARASRWLPVIVRNKAKNVWLRLLAKAAFASTRITHNQDRRAQQVATKSDLTDLQQHKGLPGVNLIGYAHTESGMGEHVRMSAAALTDTDVSFSVVNFDVGVPSRQRATLDHKSSCDSNKYKANLFHVNVDQMLLAYCHLGKSFFERRYNIGYWAWELSKCPEEWVPILGLVDEIWAPSRFIQNAFSEKTSLPVTYMPLCVSLPIFPKYSRQHFGLPERSFLFLFTFDFYSYINRKNPFASILAFKKAFDRNRNDVGLVIKVMNGDEKNENWKRMRELIDGDPRIFVLNMTMDRTEVLGLFDVCDSFVSLHRSEGFGRSPAEAMYLGKPVIVTNYSGNTDFTLADNSCLVNYKLEPVMEGEYIFEKGQVWADPDIEHAAWYMNKLVADTGYYQEVGKAGASYIHTHFSQSAIGNAYQKRFLELGLV